MAPSLMQGVAREARPDASIATAADNKLAHAVGAAERSTADAVVAGRLSEAVPSPSGIWETAVEQRLAHAVPVDATTTHRVSQPGVASSDKSEVAPGKEASAIQSDAGAVPTGEPGLAQVDASGAVDNPTISSQIQLPDIESVTVQTVPYTARLDRITAQIRTRASLPIEAETQEELAALLGLLPDLNFSHTERLIPLAEVAVAALAQDKPNLTLARALRERIQQQTRRSPVAGAFSAHTPSSRVVLGLGVLLYIAIPIALYLFTKIWEHGTGIDRVLPGVTAANLLLAAIVAVAGAVGSSVSIMVRVQGFSSLDKTDPSVLFLTGFFKPVIGTAFALFVFALIESQLIPLRIPDERRAFFYAALAFLSGFSERFATDVASRAEQMVVAVQSSGVSSK